MYLALNSFPHMSAINSIEIIWGITTVMNLGKVGRMCGCGVVESDYFGVNVVLYYLCNWTS